MMDSAGVKRQNMDLIRRLLWHGKQLTKLEISKRTGLSVATCNTLLNELEKNGEVLGEKSQIKDVGRASVVYQYNEGFESYICVSYQMIAGVKTVRVAVTSPLGNILGHYERDFRHLDYMAIEGMIEEALKKHMNAAMILVGTPSIAENGIVRHCDIAEMEEVPLVQLLEQRFGLPVHMENDIHYKAYGYYKMEGREDDIVTLCFFPANILPGTASVYHGEVLKGHNQFAGMVGFLPYEFDRKEELRLLSPETALPIIVKAVASLIVAVNPSSILLAGDLLDEEKAEQVYLGCLKWIPKEYMPDFCYTDDIDLYYQEGMYQKALDQKGVL